MSNRRQNYGIIIVGGGHAGTEAALVAARMGVNTLLVTHNIETIGQMSCNPAIGGIGKSHLVREIDALGGVMAKAADYAGIHFRILNARKGPAVRATRAQTDRVLYKSYIRQTVENQPNLDLFQAGIEDLIIKQDEVKGVITDSGWEFFAQAVVLTTGTFLGGKMHIGLQQHAGGRAGDPAAITLAQRLRQLPQRVGRLKTGTPPRLDGRTINYDQLAVQPGESPAPMLSVWGEVLQHPQQVNCYITRTCERTHDIIRQGLDQSPMYTGVIEGVGPRYCPSIEDKVQRFSDKASHQIFLEPEGLNTHEVYPNGLSTSLPFEVQYDFIHSMLGLENCHILRPGYAIEYDYLDPRDLYPSLESQFIKGLYCAGQINGTTGYEEAAAQGLLAGINAARQWQQQTAWVPKRSEAYLGVLVDDLVTRGLDEPYRMFTSRAEYRLSLREDNADLRLTEVGYQLGCVSEAYCQRVVDKKEAVEQETQRLKQIWLRPETPSAKAFSELSGQLLEREYNGIDLLRRPEVTYDQLTAISLFSPKVSDAAVAEQVSVQAKYAGYIERQAREVKRQSQYEHWTIPAAFDYERISGLSTEVKQKFIEIKPQTVAQAARIPGVTPAAISLLLVFLKQVEASVQ